MPFPLIPVVLGAGTIYAWHRAKGRKKLTEERKAEFINALQNEKESSKVRDLADKFDKEGLRAEAKELRKRADVIDLPAETKQKYRDAYKAGLSAKDPKTVLNLASALFKKGFYNSAKNLKDYAAGLVSERVEKQPEVVVAGETEEVQTEPSHDNGSAEAVGEETNAGSDSDSTPSDDS